MLIDWFTVGAQALNFLILVWLLKRFLYRPILGAIDAREKRIAAELADADARKAEAEREREEFRRKNEQLDQQRTDRMKMAIIEVGVERQRLLDEARKAADGMRAKRQEALLSEAHNLNQAISRQAQQEVFSVARMALKDLAAANVDERISEVFIDRLLEMDSGSKERLGKALETTPDPALVRSAFDLPAEHRAAIEKALHDIFSIDVRVRFVVAPELVGGIELIANGQKLAWSIADYLTSLESQVDGLLAERGEVKTQTTLKYGSTSIAKTEGLNPKINEPSKLDRKGE